MSTSFLIYYSLLHLSPCIRKYLCYCEEQSPWQVDSFVQSEEILRLLWNKRLRYCIHRKRLRSLFWAGRIQSTLSHPVYHVFSVVSLYAWILQFRCVCACTLLITELYLCSSVKTNYEGSPKWDVMYRAWNVVGFFCWPSPEVLVEFSHNTPPPHQLYFSYFLVCSVSSNRNFLWPRGSSFSCE
jgi:hypothetical protein